MEDLVLEVQEHKVVPPTKVMLAIQLFDKLESVWPFAKLVTMRLAQHHGLNAHELASALRPVKDKRGKVVALRLTGHMRRKFLRHAGTAHFDGKHEWDGKDYGLYYAMFSRFVPALEIVADKIHRPTRVDLEELRMQHDGEHTPMLQP